MKRSNGEGSISKYKDGWRGRYTDPVTHQQRAVYGKTQTEVREKLRAILSTIDNQTYITPDKKNTTVAEWLTFWFQNYYCTRTKLSTQATTSQAIRHHLIPAIGKKQLQKLTTDDIQEMINSMQSDGLAPATIRRHYKTLKQALKKAVRLNKIRFNPAENAELPENRKTEIKFLNTDEQDALKKVIPDTTSGRAVRFLLGTGMRVSELCGLKWTDIQSDGIHVERSNMTIEDWKNDGYINVEDIPKTSAGKRVIPTNRTLLMLLEVQRKEQMKECLKTGRPFERGGYIFANAIGNPADRSNLGRAFRAMCKDAGIVGRGIHSLRHTFATNWIRKSPDVPSLSRILGHSDPAFTYKTYCHADADSMTKGMEMMEEYLAI